MRIKVCLSVLALFLSAAAPSSAAPQTDRKTVASGKTQVVAKISGREITLSELRTEIARIGLSPADPNAERVALESLLNRSILAKAAREADLHRKPETMARMYAAQDQALADYYLALASQPAEPTREEIDAYIRANPSLFSRRKDYQLSILTIATKNFDEKTLTPLFDREPDFARLAAVLEKAGADYSISPARQSGAAFPAEIREQLAAYGPRDNIVIKGDDATQIMKVMEVTPSALTATEWPALARRALMEESAARRAEELLARLKKGVDVAYYRPTASPAAKAK